MKTWEVNFFISHSSPQYAIVRNIKPVQQGDKNRFKKLSNAKAFAVKQMLEIDKHWEEDKEWLGY